MARSNRGVGSSITSSVALASLSACAWICGCSRVSLIDSMTHAKLCVVVHESCANDDADPSLALSKCFPQTLSMSFIAIITFRWDRTGRRVIEPSLDLGEMGGRVGGGDCFRSNCCLGRGSTPVADTRFGGAQTRALHSQKTSDCLRVIQSPDVHAIANISRRFMATKASQYLGHWVKLAIAGLWNDCHWTASAPVL